MALNFDDDITSRIARQRKQQMAASMGKTVEQMDQDSEYFDEIKAIDAEEKMDAEAEADADADAGAAETAANEAAYAERPWYKLTESGITTGGNPYDDPDFGKPAEGDDWAQKLADEQGAGDSWRKTSNQVQAGFDSGRFGHEAGKKVAGYEEMYPDSYKDSVRSDEMSGLQREREVYQGSTFDKLRRRKQEIQQKVASQEMTPAEAEESFENYRQGLFREVNMEQAGPEFQGVGVNPPEEAAEPRITGYVEDPEMEALEAASEKEGLMPIGDAEAQIDEMAAAGEQSDIQRDENNPAVKDFKELNKKAVAGDPKALEDRKEIFKGMPKEEKAMAKEELGNYYIGPGGYAINLDKLDERKEQFQREAKFSMLQYIPDHAKPQMLASWGFIDQEDVDASPDSPTVAKEKIKVAGALAVQEMVNEGANTVAQTNNDGTFKNTRELTRSREEITKGQYKNNTDLATMNNAVKKEITGMGIEWNKVKLKADEVMHMSDNELKKWGIQFEGDMDMEQLHMVRDHFKKEMKFKYSKIRGIEKFQTAQLGQQGEQFKLTHGLKSTDQQQGWLVKQHTMMLQKAKQLLDSGQPTAAMMVYKAAGTDIEIDIPGYWKEQAKTSAFGNSAVSAAFSEMGFSTDNKNLNTGINGFVNAKKSIRKKYNDDAIDESTGMTKLDSWVKLNERNRNFSNDPLGPAWSEMNSKEQEAYPGGRPAWKAVMVSKVLKFEIGQGIYGGVAKAMEGGKINIDKTSKNKKGGNDNGKITPTVEPVEKAKKVEQSTPEGPKTTYGGPIQDILKDVYASRKKQIGMDGKTPKHTPGTLVNKEKMRKASLATGKKDLDKAIGTKIKGKLKYGGTPEKALDHFSQYPQELERLRNLDLKHYIMNELNKREVQGKIGF